jgi:tetratricopeptide (TPR) repeat protein
LRYRKPSLPRTVGVVLALAVSVVRLSVWNVAGQARGPQSQSVGAARRPLADIVQRSVPLRDGIGRAHETVTSSSKAAQAFYDQGLAYLHSFFWIEAARSFNEALRADTRVALAHVGLSYALAELGDAEGARAAAARAQALSEAVTARERLRIELRTLQLQASAGAAASNEYRSRLVSAAKRYPKDVELLLLVGRAQDPSHDAHGMEAGSASVGFYERALAQAPDYFATHHYLTHAYENIGRTDRALKHAAAFARMAPAIPHAHHMHGHVLRRVGRTSDAIEAFRKADELGSAYLAAEKIPAEYDWHYRHNLDLLGTAYQYAGQLRAAEAVLKRSFEMPATSRLTEELNRKEWPNFLLARGRAREAEAAAAALRVHPLPLVRALSDILASRALAALRRPQEAADAGNRALKQMRAAGTVGGVLVPDFQLAQGEHLLRSGQTDQARAMLRDAAAKLRAQSGPDAWVQTLFALETIARIAREQNDWTLAAEISEAMRQHDAEYAGSWYAQALVAEQRGQRETARAGYKEAVRRWAASDADFAELVDARRRMTP